MVHAQLCLPFFSRLLRRPFSSASPFELSSASWDSVRFNWLNICPLDRGVKPCAVGRRSGVLLADSIGLPPFRRGVAVRESTWSRWKPLGVFTAENEPEAAGCAGGACGVWALTAVKPPEFTGVKPDDTAGRSTSGGGVGATSPCRVAFRATDALTAGESEAFASGVPCADFFIGE
jgi:hypothetical protein